MRSGPCSQDVEAKPIGRNADACEQLNLWRNRLPKPGPESLAQPRGTIMQLNALSLPSMAQ
jgi:hypothetical protein